VKVFALLTLVNHVCQSPIQARLSSIADFSRPTSLVHAGQAIRVTVFPRFALLGPLRTCDDPIRSWRPDDVLPTPYSLSTTTVAPVSQKRYSIDVADYTGQQSIAVTILTSAVINNKSIT
jgi:hypothetical protein